MKTHFTSGVLGVAITVLSQVHYRAVDPDDILVLINSVLEL